MRAIGEAWLDTITMAVLAVLGALVFGLVFGVAKLSEHKPVRWVSWLVVEFFRAVPVIMLMTFAFYAVFNSMSIERGAYWSVVLSLTVYNGAVLAEVFRAGINALPRGQAEAAYAIGMRKSQVMSMILLPQAVKIMIPAIISQMVVALKDTSLILIVFGVGLTKILKQLPLSFNNVVPTTLVIAALYVITNLALTAIATWAQRRFVGEKDVLKVPMVGETTGGALSSQRLRLTHSLDLALDDDRAVGAYAAHAHRQVVALADLGRPLLGVGLGDAGDVGGRPWRCRRPPCPWGSSAGPRGMVASASAPIAASSPLHSAIACTVPMWLCTRRRLGITSSAWSGSMTVKRGRMEAKYGALRLKANEKTRSPGAARRSSSRGRGRQAWRVRYWGVTNHATPGRPPLPDSPVLSTTRCGQRASSRSPGASRPGSDVIR